jgi:hypothetical protein
MEIVYIWSRKYITANTRPQIPMYLNISESFYSPGVRILHSRLITTTCSRVTMQNQKLPSLCRA